MHTRSYELSPASARVMPGIQPLPFQPHWLFDCKKLCTYCNIPTILKLLAFISINCKPVYTHPNLALYTHFMLLPHGQDKNIGNQPMNII